MLIRTNIYLDNKTLHSLRRWATEENKTMAEVVRDVIEQALRKKAAPRKMTAIEAMGAMIHDAQQATYKDPDGKTDVAINHDYYLYRQPYEKKDTR